MLQAKLCFACLDSMAVLAEWVGSIDGLSLLYLRHHPSGSRAGHFSPLAILLAVYFRRAEGHKLLGPDTSQGVGHHQMASWYDRQHGDGCVLGRLSFVLA